MVGRSVFQPRAEFLEDYILETQILFKWLSSSLLEAFARYVTCLKITQLY